jgi:translation initiation factor IF-3
VWAASLVAKAARVNIVLQEKTAISTNFRHNEQIRISPIRVVNDKEEQMGVISTAEALRMAREAGMDLVEVAPNARPPVCRIMDYGKWRYQQQKKEDKSRASSRGGQLKELKLRTCRIGDHDLGIKINHARDFLKEGNKVQFTLQFRGREMAHMDLGRAIFKKVKEELAMVSKVERDSKMEGRRMTMVLQPDNSKGGASKGKNTATAAAAQPQAPGPAASQPAAAPQPVPTPPAPAPIAAPVAVPQAS